MSSSTTESSTAAVITPFHIFVTQREREVLVELTRDGAANKVMAKRLFVTEDTIKSHIKHVLGRLPHIPDRTALAVALLRGTVITTVGRPCQVVTAPVRELIPLPARPRTGLQGPRLGRPYASLAR